MIFLFQVLTVINDTNCFKRWEKDTTNFIWQGKKPWIKYKILITAKNQGSGFGLPHLKMYYEMACLCWMKVWVELKNSNTLDLERFNLVYGWHGYLYYDKAKVHKGFHNHVIRKNIYSIWAIYKDFLERKMMDIPHQGRGSKKTQAWIRPCGTKKDLLQHREGIVVLKRREEVQNWVLDWFQYFPLNEVFRKD